MENPLPLFLGKNTHLTGHSRALGWQGKDVTMAYDEGLAQMMRDDLAHLSGVTEKKMFGGLCFLLHGNMVCGVHKGGAMFRVGKDREAAAMAISGARPMDFTGRVMGGFIDVTDDTMSDDSRRGQWTAMAVENAAALPPK